MKRPYDQMSASEAVVAAGESLLESIAAGEPLTRRVVSVDVRPRGYSGREVRRLRARLGLSQAVMAAFLGVSVVALQSWEQGRRKPSSMACRFMDEMSRDPAYWRRRLAESFRVRVA